MEKMSLQFIIHYSLKSELSLRFHGLAVRSVPSAPVVCSGQGCSNCQNTTQVSTDRNTRFRTHFIFNCFLLLYIQKLCSVTKFTWPTHSVSQSHMWPQLKVYQIPPKHKTGVYTGLTAKICTKDWSISLLNQVSKSLDRTMSENKFSNRLVGTVMDYILGVKWMHPHQTSKVLESLWLANSEESSASEQMSRGAKWLEVRYTKGIMDGRRLQAAQIRKLKGKKKFTRVMLI